MTDTERLNALVEAASRLASCYRAGALNPDTDRYKWLLNDLAMAVAVYQQTTDAA